MLALFRLLRVAAAAVKPGACTGPLRRRLRWPAAESAAPDETKMKSILVRA
jgi:hypothetical protein